MKSLWLGLAIVSINFHLDAAPTGRALSNGVRSIITVATIFGVGLIVYAAMRYHSAESWRPEEDVYDRFSDLDLGSDDSSLRLPATADRGDDGKGAIRRCVMPEPSTAQQDLTLALQEPTTTVDALQALVIPGVTITELDITIATNMGRQDLATYLEGRFQEQSGSQADGPLVAQLRGS